MPFSVGIDLGTTFSAVAYIDRSTNQPAIIPNAEGNRITPSIIYFEDGKTVFGSEAESAFNYGDPRCAATFKRSMGSNDVYCIINGKAYTAVDLSAILLRHLKEDAEREMGDTIQDAVITVPAYFYSVEREATIEAAKLAGLKVKKIIDEPNAAAMAYGLNHWRENANLLVYDLGGGTFDVTLTHMNGSGELQTIVTRGNHILGGRDWDSRLETLIMEKMASETGLDFEDAELKSVIRGLSEGVKKQLSKMQSVAVNASFPNYGYVTVNVTRAEFEERTVDLIERTGVLCRAVLDEAGLRWKDVTDILLVGGSTRMPQVSDYLTKLYGKRPIAHVNPDEAVALGAAIQSSKQASDYSQLSVRVMNGKKETDRSMSIGRMRMAVRPSKRLDGVGVISLKETTAHAMGMIAVSPDGTKYINDIIIPANHPRPVKAAKAFSFKTRKRGNNEMEIFVLQGDKENPLDNQIPFRYVVTGFAYNKETKGSTIIKVQYSYDDNGVINVEARQDSSSANLPIRREPVPSDLSKYGRPVDQKSVSSAELNVVMAIDVSGSMWGQPLASAKDAMCSFVRKLDMDSTQVAVLAVADTTMVICPLTNDEDEIISKIESIEIGVAGGGNMAHPFDEIRRILADEDGRKFAIVLADGVWEFQDEAVKAANLCNDNDIETAAIGFGGADYKFLKDISSEDANAMFVSQGELSKAFGTIAQSLGTGGGKGTSSYDASDIQPW